MDVVRRRAVTPLVDSKKLIVVFFFQQTIDDGDAFAPRLDWGITEVLPTDTPQRAAERYVLERSKTLNCPHCCDRLRSHRLSLAAFTDHPGRLIRSSIPTDVGSISEFLKKEGEIDADRIAHREGCCLRKEG